MTTILHQLLIKAHPDRVYSALTDPKGLASWWTQYVTAEARVNSVTEFELAGGKIRLRMKIVKLLPQRAVIWHCLAGPTEWVGTQISFDLQLAQGQTQLSFSQRGFRNANLIGFYNFEWARYLMSLRSYLEKGKGFPDRK